MLTITRSFGILMALLSKYGGGEVASAPSCLVIVPHRDLAVQLYEWGRQLYPGCRNTLHNSIQLKVRGFDALTTKEQVSLLVDSPPRMVIGTLGGLIDVLQDDTALHLLQQVKTIVVDEADRLLDLPRKHASRAEWGKFNRHPPQLTTLFGKLARKERGDGSKMQLVMSSATMPSRLKGYIYARSEGLFGRAADADRENANLTAREKKPTVPASIDHYVVVVLPDGKTMDLAEEGEDVLRFREETPEETPRRNGQHAMPAYILECIARVFKEEKMGEALLVVKAESPMKRIVEGLRRDGIQAELLNNVGGEAGANEITGPRMVVCSEASVHGIDIPSLTHVLAVGAASSSAMYRHIAGRVGRLGQAGRGTVVTFVDGGERGVGERARMRRVVREMGID
jgi:superfamily II DNA/RNA helicase